MPKYYWLDTNVLIEAHRRYYSFDIAPGFWDAIEHFARNDKLRSPAKVQGELLAGKDKLSQWSKGPGSHLFAQSGRAEQAIVTIIGNHVLDGYQPPEANRFLAGADPWVIAHARVNTGIVVTQEVLVPTNSGKIKIPNVCKDFGVPCIDTYALLRALNVRLHN